MTFEVIVIPDRKPWKAHHVRYLETRIPEMMAEHGYVDFSIIAHHINHSMSSCEYKARMIGLEFTKRLPKPKIYYHPKIIKGDMRNLPRHRNGKSVDYMGSYRL